MMLLRESHLSFHMYLPNSGKKPSNSFISLCLPFAEVNDNVVQKQFTEGEIGQRGAKSYPLESLGWFLGYVFKHPVTHPVHEKKYINLSSL